MTPATPHGTSSIWRLRRVLSQVVLVSATGLLVVGLALAMADRPGSVAVLRAACLLLVGIPILNVFAALAVEVRRGDWRFAAATGVVLVLLALTVVRRLLL